MFINIAWVPAKSSKKTVTFTTFLRVCVVNERVRGRIHEIELDPHKNSRDGA